MPLKTLVKIGGVTNLSDARYCAGMGVDMLGIRVIQGQASYLAPQQFQEIRGWISGPLIVAELYGITQREDLSSILENYKPDMLEMGLAELEIMSTLPLPYILNLGENDNVDHLTIQPDFILCRTLTNNLGSVPLILAVESQAQVNDALTNPRVKGVAMNGSPEVRPGLKDYNILAEILEQLEVDS